MLYRVEYYKPKKMFGWTMDEILSDLSDTTMTEYTIDAENEFDAAVMAHAYASGYTGKETDPVPFDAESCPYLTIKERLGDEIRKHTIMPTHKRTDGGTVYMYKNFGGCWIIVYSA